MEGSTYPTANDAPEPLNLGTSPLDANILNELAAMLTATQIAVGVDPADQSKNYGASANFATVGAALLAGLRRESGTFSHASGSPSVAVAFAAARFTVAPFVFLMPEYDVALVNDSLYKFFASSRTTSGFTSRRWENGAYTPRTLTVRYFAIQLP